MSWLSPSGLNTRQPRIFPRVKAEFLKHLDFLWIPGFPEYVTKVTPTLVGSATLTGGLQGKVLRSGIASNTGQGATFSGQKTNGVDATLICGVARFTGTDNTQNSVLLGTTNGRGLIVRYTGQLSFQTSVFHDSSLYLDATPHIIGVVFGENYGTEHFADGQSLGLESASGLYNWSLDTLGSVSGGNTWKSIGIDLSIAMVFNKRLEVELVKKLTLNPWQIFEPEILPLWIPASGSAPQLLAPISDISAGSWTPSSGSDLYAMLDESTASDTDYIVSSTASSCEMRVTTAGDPAVSTGHILRYRLLAGTGSITVLLKQGSTTIASYGPHTLTGSAQDFAQTLTGGEADSITDYSDLRVVFTSS